MDRVAIAEAALDRVIAETSVPAARVGAPDRDPNGPLVPGALMTCAQALAAFEDMVTSRTLDVVARELKAAGYGYYTISSAGHEDDVVLGALSRPSDPAFLHYRSGAFVVARARRASGEAADHAVTEILLSLTASRDDPVARGRHKVWGSRERWIVPQTSTIASHLPKALGAAVGIGRRAALGIAPEASGDVPTDAVVIASFGDASLNHASALSALNAARWTHRIGIGVPIVFVCEDNGLGISVPTPAGWVRDTVAHLPGLTYLPVSGELHEVWEVCSRGIEQARASRTPVFLHLETTRLWGHAGSDVEVAYRSREAIGRDEARDPVLRTARQLLESGAVERDRLAACITRIRAEVRDRAARLTPVRHLGTAAEVMASLPPHRPDAIVAELRGRPLDAAARGRLHPRGLPETVGAPGDRTLAAVLRAALADELLRRPEALVFGEDVGRKGGVYGVTSGLQATFGRSRVFDTLLDETAILGLAQGLALLGMVPIAEIQYLAYLHNALDQLRGEACSTSFFSDGSFTNPMVVRIAGLAYQKGFGGHFHNDDAIGALRDIPGLAIAVPARPDDAAAMLRAALGMAVTDGRVVVFLEPIALYHERDLHEAGDGGWLASAPSDGQPSGARDVDALLLPGDVGIHHREARDVLVVTYGNGLRMALQAASTLSGEGIRIRVLDLRWLAPLPFDAIAEHAADCGAVLVADECRATGGGIADAVVAALAERGLSGPIASVRSADTYVPLGPAADAVLLGVSDIVRGVRALVGWTPVDG